jgi:hypothetical protein
MTGKRQASIFPNTNGFNRGHYGKVANKASQDRETDASAKAAVHLPHRTDPKV